jgi:hypothetical protein
MSASSLVARSAGTWKRVRVQNAFSSVRAASSLSSSAPTVRAASSLSLASTATSSSSTTHNKINSWNLLDATRQFSSALPSNTSASDEPNADVEVDSGSVKIQDNHLLVSKGDEQQEENKRRRLSDVRYLMPCYIMLPFKSRSSRNPVFSLFSVSLFFLSFLFVHL